MCLLDSRCHCENGQCSHIAGGGALPFSLLNPQAFMLQNNNHNNQKTHELSFPIISFPLQPQKAISSPSCLDTESINSNIVKKLKRESDSYGSNETQEKKEFTQAFSLQQSNNFIPIIPSFQQLNYLNNNNAAATSTNSSMNNSFPFKQIPSPLLHFGQQQQQQYQHSSPTQNSAVIEATLKDMQARVMGMFTLQSKMLTDLSEKSTLQASTISMLFEEVKSLKTLVTSKKPVEAVAEPASFITPTIYNQICVTEENISLCDPISPSKLISLLFKKKESDYKYKLILNQPLEQPLYRERNFNISVSLVNRSDDSVVSNVNRIPLNISIYTSENPPKFIDTNTSGNKILKGFTEKELQDGSLIFDKIQIKEVTSHFRNGWVFLVIFPKAMNYESGKITHHSDDIDINEIRPLIIEKVVVKAKKLKESKKHSREQFSSHSNHENDEESKDQDQKIENS